MNDRRNDLHNGPQNAPLAHHRQPSDSASDGRFIPGLANPQNNPELVLSQSLHDLYLQTQDSPTYDSSNSHQGQTSFGPTSLSRPASDHSIRLPYDYRESTGSFDSPHAAPNDIPSSSALDPAFGPDPYADVASHEPDAQPLSSEDAPGYPPEHIPAGGIPPSGSGLPSGTAGYYGGYDAWSVGQNGFSNATGAYRPSYHPGFPPPPPGAAPVYPPGFDYPPQTQPPQFYRLPGAPTSGPGFVPATQGGPYSAVPPPGPPPASMYGSEISRATSSGSVLSHRPPPRAMSASSKRKPDRPIVSKEAVDEYRERIKDDEDPEAQFNFAKYLIEAARTFARSAGRGSSTEDKALKKYRDQLLQESLKRIKRLATQSPSAGKPAYAEAQFFLANCLGNGSLGLQIDHEKAYSFYIQASKQNHGAASYRTAVCNEIGTGTRRDPHRAMLFYRKASALGDTAGMYKLGMILLTGQLNQHRNPKEALVWLKRAASQADEENPHALYELALLYERPISGANMQRDEYEALELYTQAAYLGYAPGQHKLGMCYEFGNLACPVDARRSIAWYTKAAEKGNAESELSLSGWYLTGTEGVLQQSDKEAYLWARRAANKALAKAEYAVGYYHEVGIGTQQDVSEARRWYLRAASQGNKRAMQRLTELKNLGDKKSKSKNIIRPSRQQAQQECVIA